MFRALMLGLLVAGALGAVATALGPYQSNTVEWFFLVVWVVLCVSVAWVVVLARRARTLLVFMRDHLGLHKVQEVIDLNLCKAATECEKHSQRIITFQQGGLAAVDKEGKEFTGFENCRKTLEVRFKKSQKEFYALYDFFRQVFELYGYGRLKAKSFKAYLPAEDSSEITGS